MKIQRLEYNRFADALAERGLVERASLEHILQQCGATGALMPDLLVREDLVSDWEVARVCCELYGLPYLPVDVYPPSDHARDGLDPDYLRQYGLVPLDRHGALLTVSMPGLVPSEVLEGLAEGQSLHVLPVVGSVTGNRDWLEQHLPAPALPMLENLKVTTVVEDGEEHAAVDLELSAGTDWTGIFDAGEEAVQTELRLNDAGELEIDLDLDLG